MNHATNMFQFTIRGVVGATNSKESVVVFADSLPELEAKLRTKEIQKLLKDYGVSVPLL